MKTCLILFGLWCLMATEVSLAQKPALEWVQRYKTADALFGGPVAITVDAAGNSYITGNSRGESGSWITTIKYSPAGVRLWVTEFKNKSLSSSATAMAIDHKGGIYITGYDDHNYITIRYNATTGKESWVQSFNSAKGSSNRAAAITADSKGGLYVTGYSTNALQDEANFSTIRYEAATGKQSWVQRHGISVFVNDVVIAGVSFILSYDAAIAVDSSGGLYVTGKDFLTFRYDAASGKQTWLRRYNGPDGSADAASAIAVDNKGGLYVTGFTGLENVAQFATLRYDAATGNQTWAQRYDDKSGFPYKATALALDFQGGVYVTGSGGDIDNTESDFVTMRYADLTGKQTWVQRYGLDVWEYNQANAIAVPADQGVYVTGSSGDCVQCTGFATIRYNSATGKEVWISNFQQSEDNQAQAMAIDHNGNLLIAGSGNTFDSSEGEGYELTEFITIKYNEPKSVCTASVSGFALVNGATGKELMRLREGDVLNLAALPTRNLLIRATKYPNTVGSIAFDLDGSAVVVENHFSYELNVTKSLTAGSHTLTATPYCKTRGDGSKGTSKTIHFRVIDVAVESFTLVNAATEQDLMRLTSGAILDLSTLPTRAFNIRANTSQKNGINVLFALQGATTYARKEQGYPYALFSNKGNDYFSWAPALGTYYLTATPYTDDGLKGKPLSISFRVVNKATVPAAIAYPNPIQAGTLHVLLPQQVYGNITYRLVTLMGAQVATGNVILPRPVTEVTFDFSAQTQQAGIYFLHLEGHNLQTVLRLVRQ